jgi:hypothetical protein
LRFRYASVELTSLRASVKKGLNLHQNLGDHSQKLAVVRSDFKCRIYQQAASPIFIAQRLFDDFVEKSLDGPSRRKITLETADSFTKTPIQIMVERTAEERSFVPIGIVQARARNSHGVSEVANRSSFVTVFPEPLHGGIQNGRLVKFSWSSHSLL